LWTTQVYILQRESIVQCPIPFACYIKTVKEFYLINGESTRKMKVKESLFSAACYRENKKSRDSYRQNFEFFCTAFVSFQDQLLDYNESAGVLPEGQRLMLRGIVKESAGDYSCAAVNREGETRSSSVFLRVQCK
jgi:hypothetical protein